MRVRVVLACASLFAAASTVVAADVTRSGAITAGGGAAPAAAATWLPNGLVETLVSDGSTVYVGGGFSRLGAPSGSFVVFRRGAAKPDAAVARPDDGWAGPITSDGSGGWYVGGSFTSFGGVRCPDLVHVFAGGKVDAHWCPARRYRAAGYRSGLLTRVGTRLYGLTRGVPGAHDLTDARVDIGGINLTTGRPLTFRVRLGASTTIYPPNLWTLAGSSRLVFLGGGFASVNGQPAKRLAAVDARTGALTWHADADGRVAALTVSRGRLYAAGSFRNVDGHRRSRIVALDPATGAVLDWLPKLSPALSCAFDAMVASATTVYVGGWCGVTAVSIDTGKQLWHVDTNPERSALLLALAGDRLVVASEFGQSVRALDARNGHSLGWLVEPNGTVGSVAAAVATVAISGSFGSVGGLSRIGIAALDAATGQPTDWSVDAPAVTGAATEGRTLYLAGGFTRIADQRRTGIAAVDLDTGALTPWAPRVNIAANYSLPMVATPTSVYVVGATPDLKPIAFDAATGARLSWNPDPDGRVSTAAGGSQLIFLGGDFQHVRNLNRPYLAAVDATTGIPTDWQPRPDGPVTDVALEGSTLYVAGTFARIAGQARRHFAAFDTTTGTLLAWDPGIGQPADMRVSAIFVSAPTVYAAAGLLNRQGFTYSLTPIDATTGAVRGRSLDLPGRADALAISHGRIYVGGEFGLAAFTLPPQWAGTPMK